MTAAELVGYLARECDEPADVVRDVLQALADVLVEELVAGRPATLPGIGAFRPMVRPGQTPRIQVAWQADEEITRALRTARPAAPPAGPARTPGERKARAYRRTAEAQGR